MIKIALGSDHAGFDLKEVIIKHFDRGGIAYTDFGILSRTSSDYPQYAFLVANAVAKGECTQGILICGTGIGMCITANKVKGIRAGLAYNTSTAELSRSHNNTNVLCLGGRELSPEQALEIVDIWLKTPFAGGRHKTRVDMISKLTGQ